MSIIQQHCNRLSEPRGGEHQVNGVIAIDVPRLNQQPARRRDQPNVLASRCRALELNPVVAVARSAAPSLDRRLVQPLIAVEVRYRKR